MQLLRLQKQGQEEEVKKRCEMKNEGEGVEAAGQEGDIIGGGGGEKEICYW